MDIFNEKTYGALNGYCKLSSYLPDGIDKALDEINNDNQLQELFRKLKVSGIELLRIDNDGTQVMNILTGYNSEMQPIEIETSCYRGITQDDMRYYSATYKVEKKDGIYIAVKQRGKEDHIMRYYDGKNIMDTDFKKFTRLETLASLEKSIHTIISKFKPQYL